MTPHGTRARAAVNVAALDDLDLGATARTVRYTPLDRSLWLVDLCLFAAENDDHRLASIRPLLR